MPAWVTALGSFIVGVGAVCVLVADSADNTWQLDGGVSAILGGLAAGLAAWQMPSPWDKSKVQP